MAWQTQKVPYGNDGTSLASAVAVTSDGTVGSAVEVGTGDFWADFTIASYSGGTGFDSVVVEVQANTSAATSTWSTIGAFIVGDATGIGVDRTSAANNVIGCRNEGNYQVRLYAYVNGSATTATVTCKIYPFAK